MQLLPNEQILTTLHNSSNTNHVWATNYRIELSSNTAGNSKSTIIFLENISSLKTQFWSYKVYFILAIIAVVGAILAFWLESKVEGALTLFAALFFWILWLITKKHVISVSSDGGVRIDFVVQGQNPEKVNEFIAVLCLAKEQRLKQAHKS